MFYWRCGLALLRINLSQNVVRHQASRTTNWLSWRQQRATNWRLCSTTHRASPWNIPSPSQVPILTSSMQRSAKTRELLSILSHSPPVVPSAFQPPPSLLTSSPLFAIPSQSHIIPQHSLSLLPSSFSHHLPSSSPPIIIHSFLPIALSRDPSTHHLDG